MHLVVVGLNIKSAPIEALEKLSIHHSVAALRLHELLASFDDIQGAVLLSTCNRLEFYASVKDTASALASLRSFMAYRDGSFDAALAEDIEEYLYNHDGEEAVRHLYRVASGLDSLVLGETEILGQVARAYELALGAKTTDKIINVWFQRALGVGKMVCSKASIDQYHTSVGRIAVNLAEQELGSVKDKRILLLGAGEMSELTMKHLVSKGASLVMVSNRSLLRAEALAAEYGFTACPLDELDYHLERADIVFSATASKHYLVSSDRFTPIMEERQYRPIVFIDMAVPRDIDPAIADLPGARCFDIKQIRDVSEQNRSLREQAAAAVDQCIDEKVEEFYEWLEARERRVGLL